MCKCIICDKEIIDKSIEHILPDSLGGILTLDKVCKKCNEEIGSSIDSKMLNDDLISIIRDNLKIKNKDGNLIDLSKHFSNKFYDCETNEKGIFKIQNLDGQNRVYVIEPNKDKSKIKFLGNTVFFDDISDIDLLVNTVSKKAKSDGCETFNKNEFKANIIKNFPYKLKKKTFQAKAFANKNNYIPEIVKIIYETLYYKYEQKFLNTKFAKFLKDRLNLLKDNVENVDLEFKNMKSELYIIDKIDNFQPENLVLLILSRNPINNDIFINLNFFNAINANILLYECNELDFIENRIIKLN